MAIFHKFVNLDFMVSLIAYTNRKNKVMSEITTIPLYSAQF